MEERNNTIILERGRGVHENNTETIGQLRAISLLKVEGKIGYQYTWTIITKKRLSRKQVYKGSSDISIIRASLACQAKGDRKNLSVIRLE